MERRESTKAKTGFGCPNPRDMGLSREQKSGASSLDPTEQRQSMGN